MADVSSVEPVEVDILALAQVEGADWLPEWVIHQQGRPQS